MDSIFSKAFNLKCIITVYRKLISNAVIFVCRIPKNGAKITCLLFCFYLMMYIKYVLAYNLHGILMEFIEFGNSNEFNFGVGLAKMHVHNRNSETAGI